jgi:hypothetical protein
MHVWTGKNNGYACPYRLGCLSFCHNPSDHFHPAHADGLYTHTPNAVIRQKVVVYDGKGRVSAEDRDQGT